ncbi:hypothetical protein PVAND_015970 [Polypedilum vanderplanki]|uniref:Gustatory receptor n=1 Tax=Polypedilum vanderplanki TaxID=319348 RepID=A0A9J6BE44_POLVA|nr:hypothetical protein PVAND_015970 [Polypedilum vanderplanki]
MEKIVRNFTAKKILIKPKSVYTAFHPLHIYAKFFGFAIFSINRKNFTTKFSLSDAFFVIIALSMNAFVNYSYWKVISKPSIFQSAVKYKSTINLSAPFVMFCQYLTYSVIMIISVIKKDELCLILRKLKKIDADFEEFRVKFDYEMEQKLMKKIIYLVSAIIFGLMLLNRVSSIFCDAHVDLKYDAYFLWILNCGAVLLVGFIVVAVAIRKRFRRVNLCIESLNITNKPPTIIIDKLRHLSIIHMEIVDTICIINRTFCIAMLSYFTLAFYWCCIILFILIQTPFDDWQKNHMYNLTKMMINAFMFGLLLTVIWSAAKAKNEGKETAKILYKLKNDVDVKEINEKVSKI